MTNSIATAKCPSILASGKYGMSQRRSIIDDSKEYIFVKLTDSAFRAIEEYQRNAQSKRLQKGQCAKIQFIGNSGVIQFPPTADNSTTNGSSSDGRKFGFAIDDVEGSLECIQQSGTDLDVLGSLNYRMRIHANDDVYDTTRTKMAIAEETEKSKCIREIKPNQTDIGRKVKRPVSAASIQAYSNGTTTSSLLNGNGLSSGGGNNISINGSSSYLSNSNNNHISSSSNSNSRNKLSATSLNQHSPPLSGAGGGGGNGSGIGVNSSRLMSNGSSLRSSPNPSLIGGSGTVGGASSRYGSPSNLSSSNQSTLSTNLLNGVGGISPPGSGNNILSSQHKKSNIGNGTNNRGIGKNSLGNTGKVNGTSNGKNLDVSRRKIRERLIHLLALKPFKKPELYSRLQNEGLAQRERQLISTILKDISTLSRDNTYNLRRSMWNDVDENWPFFSEQEIQQLKRRKPQNLTPPTSSDAGSSISGQSPTSSTHTGSPPPLVTTTNLNGIGGGIKRTSLEPDFYDGGLTLGMQSKKQRISHYKKDGSSSGSNLINSSNLSSGTRIGLTAGNNSNNSSSSYNQNHKSSSVTYSPHAFNATNNNNGNDENPVNADLSFNVLNNMDDFIQNTAVVGGDLSYASRSKTTSGINKNSNNPTGSNNCNSNSNITSQTSSKEKRNSGGSSSSGYGSNRESSSSSAMRRKHSPTPYGNNFVPETKISSNSNGSSTCNSNNNNNSSSSSSSSNRLNNPQQMQRLQKQTSPNYNNLNNHINIKSTNNNSTSSNHNSVISNTHDDFSPSLAPPPTAQATTNNLGKNLASSRSRHHSGSSGATNGRNGGGESSSSKHSRSSTPTQKNLTKHHSNSSSSGSGSGNSSTKTVLPQQLHNNNYNNHPHHQLQQQQLEDQQTLLNDDCTPSQTASHSSQQNQQQEHSSPTQQIAAAASTFSLTNHSTSSGDAPRYDFSSYTPITSIEQRRKYKTEFESDYDEYRKLLAQIESVGHRFRELADRLNRVQQGCSDYYNIKDQIVSEYNRIRKEEAINRDKQRFDYLHEKLAHIKQLVMDYDKKLTSGLAVPTISANQQQLKQVSPNQQQQITATSNPAHLSPMLQSSGESNHSPPLVIVNPSTTVNMTNCLPSSSASHTRKSSKHQQKNHQQKHQEHYKQHHEPVTIQMVDDDDDDNDDDDDDADDADNNNDGGNGEETAIQYNQNPYNRYEADDNNYINGQQRVTSPANSINTGQHQQQQQQQQQLQLQQQQQYHESPLQHLENQNTNDSDSESDSSSSSSSNDDDNSDDDNSDASDDDNSDDDSNDDDNDDQ